MKRMALLAAIVILAVPLFAAEEKPAQTPKAKTAAPQTATAAPQTTAAPETATAPAEPTRLAAEAPAEGDSPLVALAKRSPKTPKKGSIVINNANLGGKNAKVTTTASQRPLKTETKTEDESDSANQVVGAIDQLNKKKEAAGTEKKPMTEAEKAKRMESMRAKLESDSLDFDEGDPARVEHQLEQTSKAKTQTQTTADPKKP